MTGKYIGGTLTKYKPNSDIGIGITDGILRVFTFTTGLDKIPLNKILSCQLQLEEEIKNNIILGRLLIFGILAFGLKKEKIDTRRHLVIRYLDDKKQEQSIIIYYKNGLGVDYELNRIITEINNLIVTV